MLVAVTAVAYGKVVRVAVEYASKAPLQNIYEFVEAAPPSFNTICMFAVDIVNLEVVVENEL